MEALTNFVSCYGKMAIHMGTWMARKDSMKRYHSQRRNSKAIRQWRTSHANYMSTTNMLKEFGKTLDFRPRLQAIINTCITE